jgi:hypothetical protein
MDKIKSITQGWGQEGSFFTADLKSTASEVFRVDEIKEEIKVTGNGLHCDTTITVYRGYKNGNMVWEMEANNAITLYFEVVEPPKEGSKP